MVDVNTILKSVSDGHLHRVLWLSKDQDVAYLFDMSVQEMPNAIRCTDIDWQIEDGLLERVVLDPFMRVVPEVEIPEKSKQLRDQIWAFMENLVLCEPDIYEKSKRGKLVSAKMTDTGKR